ncbi:hypothetical protein [Terasakiella sp.]|uniref:hypothetical protein n=1 Tax=Terasakiella sp. TaxID=2034861 RepID=UPI003AA9AEB6
MNLKECGLQAVINDFQAKHKMRILFEYRPQSYLPEIQAYRDYLQKFDFVTTSDTNEMPEANPKDYDVFWRFMGMARFQNAGVVVHEYNSLSTAPFARFKNFLKKRLNHTPDFRVFLSEQVSREFNFNDGVPSGVRDMGINKLFYQPSLCRKTFDHHLVYMGSLTKSRNLTGILEHISQDKHGLKILLIGEPEPELFKQFKNCAQITFTGRVPQKDIPQIATTAFAGLNYTPDFYPYNAQTSTKLLEYCALGLNVVSTKYAWVRDFEEARKANFFWLNDSFQGFDADNLENYAFITPDVSDLEWNKVIEKSQIFENLFKEIGLKT